MKGVLGSRGRGPGVPGPYLGTGGNCIRMSGHCRRMGAHCIAAFLLCCAVAGGAETAQERGKRVINEAIQALGGDAFLRMQDRVESGRAYSFYRGQLSGLSVAHVYTRYLEPPNPPVPDKLELRERETYGKQEEDVLLFRPDGAWEITFRGAQPLPDERVTRYQDSTLRNILYILRARLNEPGLSFYSQGMDFFDNRPVEIVDITDAHDLTVTVYFDRSSKLPVRQVYKRKNPDYNDFDTEVTLFAKYRDVGGGVQWPLNIRRDRNGEKVFEMYSESVVINQGLKDSLFELPPNVKMLPKAK
jgi:hypothetical protein